MNEGINLLEPIKKGSSISFLRHIQLMRLIVVSILFVVSISSVILFILVSLSPLPVLKQQQTSLEQTITSSKNYIVMLALTKERAASISQFLNTRHKYGQTLRVIQSKLSGNDTVTALQTSTSGLLVTVDSNSLEDIDNFLNSVIVLVQQKEYFSQVIMVDLALNQNNNDYEVILQLKPLTQ